MRRNKNMKMLKTDGLYGNVQAVQSKSDAHRALICAALCNGQTKIEVSALNDDIIATADALNALGARVIRTENGYTVTGRAVGGGVVQCKESGSTARFLLPVCGALGKVTTLSGCGKLPMRPMLPLTEEMRKKGCCVSADNLPITVSGKLLGGRYVISGDVSSQFISGLMMALPLTDTKCEILLSSPLQSELYADMTAKTLRAFGVCWEKIPQSSAEGHFGGYELIAADGRCDTYTSCGKYTVEGDWSGAAFFAVAGAISGELTLSGLDTNSLQPDKAIIDIIRLAGAMVEENDGQIKIKKSRINPIKVDVSQYPDIFPILAVLACAAEGESLLYNAGRLRIKESDRIESTAKMIQALGGKVEAGKDFLKIFGTGGLDGGIADGAGDHRIVMSAATASLICKGEVDILGEEAVNKSFPDFFERFYKVRVK